MGPLEAIAVAVLAAAAWESYMPTVKTTADAELARDPAAPPLAADAEGWHLSILATSEEPQADALGGQLLAGDLYAALPSREALRRWIEIRYPVTGRTVKVPIRDVGPWNWSDPYWRTGTRPRAEVQWLNQLKADNGRVPSNTAGLDISWAAWRALGVQHVETHSGRVAWRFVESPIGLEVMA